MDHLSLFFHFAGRGPMPLKISFPNVETRDSVYSIINDMMNTDGGIWSTDTHSVRVSDIQAMIKG